MLVHIRKWDITENSTLLWKYTLIISDSENISANEVWTRAQEHHWRYSIMCFGYLQDFSTNLYFCSSALCSSKTTHLVRKLVLLESKWEICFVPLPIFNQHTYKNLTIVPLKLFIWNYRFRVRRCLNLLCRSFEHSSRTYMWRFRHTFHRIYRQCSSQMII